MRSQNSAQWCRTQRCVLISCALVALLAAGACSRSDTDVQTELQQQLAADSATAGVTATVTEGVAHLSGVTDSKAQQDRAMDITRAVKGVKEVRSTMRLNDAALTAAVRSAIAADETIRAVPLTIEVHDGEVRLFSDKTNSDQRAKLTQIASAVYGVTHVEDNMK